MSKHGSVFILLNLGSEMLYVVSQRLKAQKITDERSYEVLDTIVSNLINDDLLEELTKNPALNHAEMKHLIENIAQSSIMRLDSASKDRLWDLITMVFKWQLFMSNDTFIITIRHLYEIETFVTTPKTQLNLHQVQNHVDDLAKRLTDPEKHQLFHYLHDWFENFDVRVSLLLRLGFQKADASFEQNSGSKYRQMLDNLGENIYAAAAQLNVVKARTNTALEVNTVVGELLGPPRAETAVFKLSLGDTFTDAERCDVYSEIDVESTNSYGVFDVVHTTQEDCSIHEELIQMLDETL